MKEDTDIISVSLQLLEELDTPRSLAVYLMVKYREWGHLAAIKFDPTTVLSWSRRDPVAVDRARRDYQASDLLRKNDFIPPATDLEEDAISDFLSSERRCFLTNERLEYLHVDTPHAIAAMRDPTGAIRGFTARVKKIIQDIIGSEPPLYGDLMPRFGPGSVFEASSLDRRSRQNLTVLDKIDRLTPHVTDRARHHFLPLYWETAWGRVQGGLRTEIEILPGNRFTTVPKSFSQRRGICVEGGGNVYCQLAVGGFLRRRLRKVGLLLPEGKSEALHHRLAKLGSRTDLWATIDLSKASDTVARVLVDVLLPCKWVRLLNDLRSPVTSVAGKRYYLNKFSSMGNGFTFELETLVFYAISRAVVGTAYDSKASRLTVYGDDIIVPSERARDVIAALRYFGFETNERKTYRRGHFRESCGGDYFNGEDIAPFRVTDEPVEPHQWLSVCNGIRKKWGQCGAWKLARRNLPSVVSRCQGPSHYGDLCLHVDDPKGYPSELYQTTAYKLWCPVNSKLPMDRHDADAILAYALLGGDAAGPTPRGAAGVSGYKVAWSLPRSPVHPRSLRQVTLDHSQPESVIPVFD